MMNGFQAHVIAGWTLDLLDGVVTGISRQEGTRTVLAGRLS